VIAPATTVGPVHLTVSDLDRSRAYYRDAIGLETLDDAEGRMSLGAGDTELLVLTELPGARPAPHATGLFHYALLLPDRPSLARWLAHAARDRVELTGLSDHDVSEALYLRDPDFHGIEIYADRPRELWQGEVAQRLTTQPLDVKSLLGELESPADEPFDGLPPGTRMGHVHLQVGDVDSTLAFYRDRLGFDLMARLGDEAVFLAAGGYHHHVGANTWQSRGASPPPAGSAALRHATIVFPDAAARDAAAAAVGAGADGDEGPLVRDPSGNALVLAVAGQRKS